jgi:hypothetical protein
MSIWTPAVDHYCQKTGHLIFLVDCRQEPALRDDPIPFLVHARCSSRVRSHLEQPAQRSIDCAPVICRTHGRAERTASRRALWRSLLRGAGGRSLDEGL